MKKLCKVFLWNGAKPKIVLTTLQANKVSGGLKLVNLKKKERALKLTWLQVLKNETQYANMVYTFMDPILKEDIWRCNLEKTDVKLIVKNDFWKAILESWADYNYQTECSGEQLIWWNSKIRIANKPVRWEKAYKNGLKMVNQLFENGKPLPVCLLQDKYGLTQMETNMLFSALLKENKNHCFDNGEIAYTYDVIIECKFLSSKLYI